MKNFNESGGHEGCWVDTNTGKILLRVKGSSRGRVIKNTRDLVEIDNTFLPEEWIFCSAPVFKQQNDTSTPVTLNNLTFSPIAPGIVPGHAGFEGVAGYQPHLVRSPPPRGGRSSNTRGAWVDQIFPQTPAAGGRHSRGRNHRSF